MLETVTIRSSDQRQTSTTRQSIREQDLGSAARVGAVSTANTGLESRSMTRSTVNRELSTESRSHPDGLRPLPTSFRVSDLKTWTGRVIEVDEDLFTAELSPGERTPGGDVLADFSRDLVVDEDEPLQVGDVIYVTTRMVRAPHGGRSETSSVRLRRPGKWTDEDVARLSSRASDLANDVSHLFD